MNNIWNRMKTDRYKVGGGIPVWLKHPEAKLIGGTVLNSLQDMEKLSAGTPVEYDNKARTIKMLKEWQVKSAVADGANTVVTVKATFISPELYAGLVVMKMPATLNGTGKAVLIGKVTQNVDKHEASFTVATADIDGLVKGDFIVESSSDVAGAGKSIYCQPTTVSIADTIGGDQTFADVPLGVNYIYENCIPAMPDVVKNAIKNMEWEWFN
ncbi:MAG: hypothetical protein RRY36_09785, partial [Bacteroidaceae bacterium]